VYSKKNFSVSKNIFQNTIFFRRRDLAMEKTHTSQLIATHLALELPAERNQPLRPPMFTPISSAGRTSAWLRGFLGPFLEWQKIVESLFPKVDQGAERDSYK
jgi:hypothetical protein